MLKRYGVIVLAAALLGILVSYAIPDEYAANAKLSDEYKVTDLAVGLDRLKVMLREANPSFGNSGTDDIEIYSQILLSEDFFDRQSQLTVSKYGTSYLQYIKDHHDFPLWERPFRTMDDETCKEIIRNSTNYNLSFKSQTLEIQVIDQDPQVAAEILTKSLSVLRHEIERHRQQRAQVARENARKERAEAGKAYHEAISRYAAFADAHQNLSTKVMQDRMQALKNDYQLKHNIYEKAAQNYIRADYLTQKANTSFVIVKNCTVPEKPLHPQHWVYALTFCCLTALLCFWHSLYRKRKAGTGQPRVSLPLDFGGWFAPWTLTVGIWGLILGLYYLQESMLYPITEQFYYCLALWLPVFCVSAFLTYQLLEANEPPSRDGIALNKSLFTFFFIISVTLTPFCVYRVLQIVMMFSTEDLMSNIRILALYGEGSKLLDQTGILNQALFVVALWAYPRVPMWQVVALAVACLLNSLAIMEKGTMFFVFISIIFVLFEKKVITLRSTFLYGALLILFFYIFNLARAGEDSDYSENETLLDFFAMYVLSPPVAFCQLLPDVTPQFGTNTFETVYHFLKRFGVDGIVEKLKTQEFVWVPIPTNVYTVFQPFFIDFGYKGVAFFSGVYGVLCGWFYRLYRNGSGFGGCFYTFLVYVLILQFYQENLFFSMATVAEFAFFIYLTTQQRVALNFQPSLT